MWCMQELGKPVFAEFRFEMAADFNYDDFFANKVKDFKTGVKAQVRRCWWWCAAGGVLLGK